MKITSPSRHHLCFIFLLVSLTSATFTVNPSKVKQISWNPRAFVYEGLLTELECDHLIAIAKSELKRSAVADNLSGKSKLCEVRTSSGMFIPKGKDDIVAGIEDKLAKWTFLPKENGEDIQVLRYEPGQKYEPHCDYFADKVNIARGGHRVATVLMYLTDVAKGGETVFPLAEEVQHRRASVPDASLSDCAKKGIAVKPRRGDALLFFSLHPNAIPDTNSLHAGCPVIEGEKWSATKWIMSTHLTRLWILVETAQIKMRAVRDGLPLGNAPRTESIWLDLLTFLATVGGVARFVRLPFMVPTLIIRWKAPFPGVIIDLFFGELGYFFDKYSAESTFWVGPTNYICTKRTLVLVRDE